MPAEDSLQGLVASVTQGMKLLEEELGDTQTQLDMIIQKLPERFVPREEAEKKAGVVRKWLGGIIAAGVIVAASALTGWMVNFDRSNQSLKNCETTREGFRQVIERAVTNPALREELLSVDGTKPELCR